MLNGIFKKIVSIRLNIKEDEDSLKQVVSEADIESAVRRRKKTFANKANRKKDESIRESYNEIMDEDDDEDYDVSFVLEGELSDIDY